MEAWACLCPVGENYGSWIKVIQKSNKSYIEFLARLKQKVEKIVIGEVTKNNLICQTFKHANEGCNELCSGNINSYRKIWKDILSKSIKLYFSAETMVTSCYNLQKGNKNLKDLKCFGYEQISYLAKKLRQN